MFWLKYNILIRCKISVNIYFHFKDLKHKIMIFSIHFLSIYSYYYILLYFFPFLHRENSVNYNFQYTMNNIRITILIYIKLFALNNNI